MMILDLKRAYEESIRLAKQHTDITIYVLKELSLLVMQNTGSSYKTALGEFSSANGDLRLVNATAGVGGISYMSYQKVPAKLQEFCNWLNALQIMHSSLAISNNQFKKIIQLFKRIYPIPATYHLACVGNSCKSFFEIIHAIPFEDLI